MATSEKRAKKPESPVDTDKPFVCPHCRVLGRHDRWSFTAEGMMVTRSGVGVQALGHINRKEMDDAIKVTRCPGCNEVCIWYSSKRVYPSDGYTPPPHEEMPPEVSKLYLEAARVYQYSPRGAAALLRLGVQLLCINLGGDGKNLNSDIKCLVSRGLPVKVQQALDVVRVIGNNAVHPGQIDTDSVETTERLFELLNIITEYMISAPAKVDRLFNSLPGSSVDSIRKRDT